MRRQIFQLRQRVVADAAGVLHQSFFLHDLQIAQTDRGADGMTAEGVDVAEMAQVAGLALESVEDVLLHGCRSQGHIAARKPLRHRDDVRLYLPVVVAEQFARASKTGDDLVKDQQHAVLVADFAHARQVFVGGTSTPPPEMIGSISSAATVSGPS